MENRESIPEKVQRLFWDINKEDSDIKAHRHTNTKEVLIRIAPVITPGGSTWLEEQALLSIWVTGFLRIYISSKWFLLTPTFYYLN